MKCLLVLLLIFSDSFTGAHGFVVEADTVRFDGDEAQSMDTLSMRLRTFFHSASKSIPEYVRLEINQAKLEDFPKISQESLSWIDKNIEYAYENDTDLFKAIGNVAKWSGIEGRDMPEIVRLTFYAYLNNQDFQIVDKISDCIIARREANPPDVKFSPNGQGKIEWLWKLSSTKKRKYGVLHVGIDLKKRTFICFEGDVGLFFPEGETMERIYTEIVQDPDMAGIWVGKGYKDSK